MYEIIWGSTTSRPFFWLEVDELIVNFQKVAINKVINFDLIF